LVPGMDWSMIYSSNIACLTSELKQMVVWC